LLAKAKKYKNPGLNIVSPPPETMVREWTMFPGNCQQPGEDALIDLVNP
jgi:hypothetical protein